MFYNIFININKFIVRCVCVCVCVCESVCLYMLKCSNKKNVYMGYYDLLWLIMTHQLEYQM